ncbi:FkbM family methyltransferase [Cylindrospermopsis raciborskii]|uniref:FkbM family methyltransferase n=1 Tax=Cylindrospermopsis raciborskii TaxID=77022 RepID=UPI001454DC82|nr:FkbM family methyltransferase [Cylindrospermopsis raciborskii]
MVKQPDFDIMNESEQIISNLLTSIPALRDFHSPSTQVYRFLESVSKVSINNLFGKHGVQKHAVGKFGTIDFPYFSMGSINSTHLFGLDELIIFAFYESNKQRYKNVADLGANIGLHSIMMTRLGWNVTAYEPDPTHFNQLQNNVIRNDCMHNNVKLLNKAVSVEVGEVEFIRVVGNTTGSHIAGSKNNLYGDLDRFMVSVDSFRDICNHFDLLKIDVEGHESDILLSTVGQDWQGTDAIVEIGSASNAEKVFHHFSKLAVNLFSQKRAWQKVNSVEEMPFSYKDGSLFISSGDVMPW